MTYIAKLFEHRENIHLLRLAQFLSDHKGKSFQTSSIYTSGEDLLTAGMQVNGVVYFTVD